MMPDAQVRPGRPIEHLTFLGHYCVLKKPDVIVCIGDFADMSSLSTFDVGKKSFEGRSYEDDVNAARAAMQAFLRPIIAFNEAARRDHKPLYTPELHMALGNHEYRIVRAVNNDRKLVGTLRIEDLGYTEAGFVVHPFLHPFVIDGVAYCHFFPSGPKGLPITTARRHLSELHHSTVCGHKPGRDIAYSTRADGTQMTSIIAGSFYTHDEDYVLGPQRHWRGFYMLHEVVDGAFDEMAVSMNYLQRKAKKEGWV